MSFFTRFNNASAPKAMYKRIGELPIFRVMKMLSVGPYETSIGPTIKVNAILGEQEVFFFLGKEDCSKFEVPDFEYLNGEISARRSPFLFIAKTRNGSRSVIIPFGVEVAQIFSKRGIVPWVLIPETIKNELNVPELAAAGIIWQ